MPEGSGHSRLKRVELINSMGNMSHFMYVVLSLIQEAKILTPVEKAASDWKYSRVVDRGEVKRTEVCFNCHSLNPLLVKTNIGRPGSVGSVAESQERDVLVMGL